MFKWFKFGVAGITGLLIIVGIIIGIAFTVIFNLYVDKQKRLNEEISTVETIEQKDDFKKGEKSIKENQKRNKGIEPGILSKENFDLLEKGMSYKEVVKILGSEGKKDSERISDGSESITYKFAEKDRRGIDISASFLNGELSFKSYSYITIEDSETPISAESFDKLKPGMSYEEVSEIIGGEGILVSDYGFSNEGYHSMSYSYTGIRDGSRAQFTFRDDKLDSKSQDRLE